MSPITPLLGSLNLLMSLLILSPKHYMLLPLQANQLNTCRPIGLRLFSHWATHNKLKLITDWGAQPDPLKIFYKDGEFNTKQAYLIIPQVKQLLNMLIILLKLFLTKKGEPGNFSQRPDNAGHIYLQFS